MNQQDSIQVHVQDKSLQDVGIKIAPSSLRAPVMQIDTTKPAHLTQPKPVWVKPRITYQKLNHNDSIYLNLIQADSDHIFDSEHSFKSVISNNETVAIIDEKEELASAPIDTVPIQPEISRENIETVTIAPESTATKTRGNNQFNECKEWLSGFILFSLIIAGAIKLTSGKYLNDIFSSIRYQQSATKLFSTFNVQNQKPGIGLSVIFIINSSLLVFEYAMVLGRQPQSMSSFLFLLMIIGGIILFFIGKSIIYRFIGFVFDTMVSTKAYLFNSDLLNKAFGLALLPFVAAVPFVDIITATFLLKAALALFLLMYVVQLLRGVKIILHSPLSIFYMFLYFCALEILPLSILIKTMIL